MHLFASDMNPDSKIEGYKTPDPILPYGSTSKAISGMSQRELVKLVGKMEHTIQGQRNEIVGLKREKTMGDYTLGCSLEMLGHEVSKHVETPMKLEDHASETEEAKNQRRHALMESLCHERAGDHYALYHGDNANYHYCGVKMIVRAVYCTHNKTFRNFDNGVKIWGHNKCVQNSKKVMKESKEYLEASRAGTTARVTVVDIVTPAGMVKMT